MQVYQDEDEEEVGLSGESALQGRGAGEQKMVAVQGQDGQQYVVLEVIQLQVGAGTGDGRWRWRSL